MIIKGEKLNLRPIKLADAPRFVKWINDPEINKNLCLEFKVSLRKEQAWIKNLSRNKNKEIQFAIDTKEGVHIGSIGFSINTQSKYIDLGILIGDKNYWGKGYGNEAMKLIINYVFREMDVNRIELEVISYNERAISLYKNLGFKIEGIMRKRHLYDGKFYDEYKMGILRDEWQNK